MEEILVEEYRGDILECVHRGHICCVSRDGEVKFEIGDANFLAYLRSSAKPIQAVPLIKHGIDKKYGFTDREIAIITGSHRAESFHVEAVEAIMAKISIAEEDLICLPTYPLSATAKESLLKAGKPPRKIYHNCSGKHVGILSLCRFLGCDIKDYWKIESPAQQEILSHIALIADYPKEKIGIGTDGCGVPVFALPMKHLAKAYLRMACPDLIEDTATREAVIRITTIMNTYPEMVSNTNLICSLLLKDKNIIAKGGSKGVYCFGLKEEGLGFAIKILDGSEEEWAIIIASILEQIDYKNKATIADLYKHFPLEVKNDNQKVVGWSNVVFKI